MSAAAAPFWEAAEKGDRLTVRWSADERRGRLLWLTLAYAPCAYFLVCAAANATDSPPDAVVHRAGAALVVALYLLVCGAVWRGRRWVFDRKAAVLYEGMARRASFSEITRIRIKRIKVLGTGGVVFRLYAERGETADPLFLGEMNQDDAHAVGVALAHFTGFPLIEH